MNARLVPPSWAGRLRLALELGQGSSAGVPLRDLTELLTDDAPRSEAEVGEWIIRNLPQTVVANGRAYSPYSTPGAEVPDDDARAEAYLHRAREFFGPWIEGHRNEIRCAAVTGSVAYGSAGVSDDLDLLVCTAQGAVWAFLARAFLEVRRRPRRGPAEPSRWCFNFVADDRTLTEEYVHARGLLYAREALMARIVLGELFYRSLLGECPWMASEAPRLYRRWEQAGFPPRPPSAPAPWPVRLANLALYLLLAPYLQLVGLRRNHRLRREGRFAQEFRTVTRLGRLFYQSRRFDELARRYREVSITGGR
ncbi:MAG: hypothetical protein ACYCPN_05190 [Thermoplasmata archaeon]